MNTLFALVINICSVHAGCVDAVLNVYDSKALCEQAEVDQRVAGECYPVDGIVRQIDAQ
jgi:hypothetical protein